MNYKERLPIEEIRKLTPQELLIYISDRSNYYNTLKNEERLSLQEREEIMDIYKVNSERRAARFEKNLALITNLK